MRGRNRLLRCAYCLCVCAAAVSELIQQRCSAHLPNAGRLTARFAAGLPELPVLCSVPEDCSREVEQLVYWCQVRLLASAVCESQATPLQHVLQQLCSRFHQRN